jgi:antitoxin (DNA-binding transcriptional repressor) of toxin-antitoxin stability system
MEAASIYTMRELNQDTARVMNEIREAGKPAYITSYGRFIAVITPLEPGQVEQQALAAITREMTVPRSPSTQENQK